MKLKEKLAEESAKDFEEARKKLFPMLDPNSFTNEAMFVQLGYLKGFDKAREMAIEISDDEGCINLDRIGEEDV